MCLTFKLEINVVYVSQFPGVISVKNPPAGDKRDTSSYPGLGRSLGVENGSPLQYSCWKIPWIEEPGRLQSMRLQRVGHD